MRWKERRTRIQKKKEQDERKRNPKEKNEKETKRKWKKKRRDQRKGTQLFDGAILLMSYKCLHKVLRVYAEATFSWTTPVRSLLWGGVVLSLNLDSTSE